MVMGGDEIFLEWKGAEVEKLWFTVDRFRVMNYASSCLPWALDTGITLDYSGQGLGFPGRCE